MAAIRSSPGAITHLTTVNWNQHIHRLQQAQPSPPQPFAFNASSPAKGLSHDHMTTKKHLKIHETVHTRTLAPEELNARRQRKAFTAPLAVPHGPVEPPRTGRRTVDHPGIHPSEVKERNHA